MLVHAAGFQLFVSGDGPNRCLHPDRPEASVHEFHRLVGPDDNSQGHGWSIGKHPEDGIVDSMILFVNPKSISTTQAFFEKKFVSLQLFYIFPLFKLFVFLNKDHC